MNYSRNSKYPISRGGFAFLADCFNRVTFKREASLMTVSEALQEVNDNYGWMRRVNVLATVCFIVAAALMGYLYSQGGPVTRNTGMPIAFLIPIGGLCVLLVCSKRSNIGYAHQLLDEFEKQVEELLRAFKLGVDEWAEVDQKEARSFLLAKSTLTAKEMLDLNQQGSDSSWKYGQLIQQFIILKWFLPFSHHDEELHALIRIILDAQRVFPVARVR
jgi:hypothetical protein